MFKVVVCEDNELVLEKLSGTIQKIFRRNHISGEIVCKAMNAKSVEEYLKHNDANIFFLDIYLKAKETGLSLAEKIRENDVMSYVVFLTGHLEFALQAYKVKAFDFLPKPVTEEVLELCILRIYKDYSQMNNVRVENDRYIEVKQNNSLCRIKTKDIVFVEKVGFKILMYMVGSQISYYDTLENFSKLLTENCFVRCHKSFIANTTYISEIHFKEKKIKFDTGHECCIGDKYKECLTSLEKKEIQCS